MERARGAHLGEYCGTGSWRGEINQSEKMQECEPLLLTDSIYTHPIRNLSDFYMTLHNRMLD